VFFTAVGTAFPVYRQVIGADAEGVTGIGSWSGKTSPAARAYFEAHVKKFQKEPDRWASAHCWASLQILQAAIEKVGLDRKAIRDYIAGNEHATILGPIRFKGSEIQFPGTVSQWVGGDFEVVWPPDRATAQLVIPKPAWK
jgi:branched-chain amino acid transport system substrate-binding protein